MGAAISPQTLDLLDDAAGTTPTSVPLERRQSIALATTLETLPEVDEENDDISVSSPLLQHSYTTTTTTATPHNTLSTPSPYLETGRPVLVTRQRETVQYDATHVDPATLREAEQKLKSLLNDIEHEEKQLRYEQKKERNRIDTLKRKEKLGIRIDKKKLKQMMQPKGTWIQVISVWQAQNGIRVVADTTDTTNTTNTTNTSNTTNPALTFVVHNPDRIRIITRLAAVLIRLGDLIGAQNIWEKMIEQCVHDFGRDHPHTLTSVVGLANVLMEQDRVVLAEVAARRGLTGLNKVVGSKHPMTRYARRLLIRIVHKLSLLKPQYYEEQERLLREDLRLEKDAILITTKSSTTNISSTSNNPNSGGQSLFAHYNLASFCVHFGRYDEATTILRAAVKTMSLSIEKAKNKKPLRPGLFQQANVVPGTPPKTPPQPKKCPYVLKTTALNTTQRIEEKIKGFQRIVTQWEDKVKATIEAGHPRSASFYQSKAEIAKMKIQHLHDQKEERRQQLIAQEDLIMRRKIQERHTFARTVLRRQKLDYERQQNEEEVARLGAPASASTFLDLLPQTWECINLLAELLERKLRRRDRKIFVKEEENERNELECLMEWMEIRQAQVDEEV